MCHLTHNVIRLYIRHDTVHSHIQVDLKGHVFVPVVVCIVERATWVADSVLLSRGPCNPYRTMSVNMSMLLYNRTLGMVFWVGEWMEGGLSGPV